MSNKAYEKYGVTWVGKTNGYHTHPFLAFERVRLEHVAQNLAESHTRPGQKFIDVGASGRCHVDPQWIHMNMPLLAVGDLRRHREAEKRATHCECIAQICTHISESSSSCLVFCHSAYYFPVADIIRLMAKTTTGIAYVIGHDFPDAYGQMAGGEMDYRWSGDQVRCKVTGNTHEYCHHPLAWTVPGASLCGEVPQLGPMEVEVTVMKILGSTTLWRLDLCCAEPPAPTLRVTDIRSALSYEAFGDVAVPNWKEALRHVEAPGLDLNLTIDAIHALGPVLLVDTNQITVTLPKAMIQVVAASMAFRPRTPDTFRDCVYQVREMVLKARMPAHLILPAITFGSALAFSTNVGLETSALQTITSRFGSDWTRLHQLLEFRPLEACSRWWPYIIFALSVVLAIVLFSVHQSWSLLAGSVELMVGVCLALGLSCCFAVVRAYQDWRGRDWITTVATDRRATSVTNTVTFSSRVPFRGTTDLREPLLPDPESAEVRVGEDPHPPRHPGAEPPTRAILTGIAVASRVPTVVEPNQSAELAGVTNRITGPPLPVDVDALEAYECVFAALDFGDVPPDDEVLFSKWVLKFPESQRKILTDARSSARNTDPVANDMKVKAFTKEEKGKIMSVTGEIPTKPRIIQQPSDRVKAMVGPFIDAFAKQVRRAWNGLTSSICYVSGMTADAVGEVFDAAIVRLGGWGHVVILILDFEVFDSTVRNELFGPRAPLYERHGMGDQTSKYLAALRAQGSTRHGVKYRVKTANGDTDIEILSGVMDTNLWGSLVNGCSQASSFVGALHPIRSEAGDTSKYHDGKLHPMYQSALGLDILKEASASSAIFVAGDDGMLVMRASDYDEDFKERFLSGLRALGLKPTLTVARYRHEVEFCSRLAWQGVNKAGRTQTVFGAKPGRIFHRMGWNLTVPGALNLYGACVGVGRDNNHVPLVAEFVERTKTLIAPKDRVVRGKEWSEMKVSQQWKPSRMNYSLLQLRYGVTEEDCSELRRVFKGVTALPAVIDHPLITRMVDVDAQ
jgi:hypothetical protein